MNHKVNKEILSGKGITTEKRGFVGRKQLECIVHEFNLSKNDSKKRKFRSKYFLLKDKRLKYYFNMHNINLYYSIKDNRRSDYHKL